LTLRETARQAFSLSFQQRLNVVIKRVERLKALTEKTNLMTAETTKKQANREIVVFMNQLIDLDHVFDLTHE
jgi:site-specific recombinase